MTQSECARKAIDRGVVRGEGGHISVEWPMVIGIDAYWFVMNDLIGRIVNCLQCHTTICLLKYTCSWLNTDQIDCKGFTKGASRVSLLTIETFIMARERNHLCSICGKSYFRSVTMWFIIQPNVPYVLYLFVYRCKWHVFNMRYTIFSSPAGPCKTSELVCSTGLCNKDDKMWLDCLWGVWLIIMYTIMLCINAGSRH